MADRTDKDDDKQRTECTECKKTEGEDGEDWLECDFCENWTHRACVSMNRTVYKALEKPNNNILFICNTCKAVRNGEKDKEGRKVEERIEAGRKGENDRENDREGSNRDEKIEKLMQKIESMREQLQKNDDSIEGQIEKKMKEVEERLDRKIQVQMQGGKGDEIIGDRRGGQKEQISNTAEVREDSIHKREDWDEESKERAKRTKNILMFGIPEAKKEENRNEADIRKVRKVMKELHDKGEDNNEIQTEQIIRLGRRGERPRPIRVCLETKDQRNTALKNSKRLKDHEKQHLQEVYVGADQTIRQREQGRELRKELKKRKEEGEDVVIHRHQIIVRNKKREQDGEMELEEEGQNRNDGASGWDEE
eukprot:TRINITY_DN1418_c0_g2_i4.p2 TRINITY_DN1418_c0_g2~~TRINITY_DN1418_c0_g2_i4.p2  ORF type:complete len:365 (+),score=98.63 TRINITY_DN1418_c0_g2_i4:233-1327(+)